MPVNVVPFPKSAREVAKLASLRPAPVIDHPMSAALGFPAVEPVPVDQDGGRILLWGVPLTTFVSASNATRAAAALETLVDLGLLTPKGALRSMLEASLR